MPQPRQQARRTSWCIGPCWEAPILGRSPCGADGRQGFHCAGRRGRPAPGPAALAGQGIHFPFQRFGVEVEGVEQGNGLSGLPEVDVRDGRARSEEHTSELQSHLNLVFRLLLEKKKMTRTKTS